jgi:methionyl-tRNA synthetase
MTFKKIELREARVVKVEAVPRPTSIYRMDLDLGYERRTIVSGIREFRAPEDLVREADNMSATLKPPHFAGWSATGSFGR